MPRLSSWWASSTSSRRHGTITVRELTAGKDVDKVGFCVPSLPPAPVVIKKVSPGTWAADQELRTGDVLIELNDFQTSEMSTQQFLSTMDTRPLRFKFIVNPLKSAIAEREVTPDGSEASASEGSCDEAEPTSTSFPRGSVSDWYAEEPAGAGEARKASLTNWYLDGEKLPDTGSRLTTMHRLSFTVETGGDSELGGSLQTAVETEDLDALLKLIVEAQAQGIMADQLDAARAKASQLQDQLLQGGSQGDF
ncbi:unnamed protein product [Effrenium voratum]|nr:unnamed protein product [Effrenium voratum]